MGERESGKLESYVISKHLEKLEVLVNRLRRKPSVIVCTETWTLKHTGLFNLPGYKLQYNESNINKSDGVILNIKDNLIQSTETIRIHRLSITHTDILINDNETENLCNS